MSLHGIEIIGEMHTDRRWRDSPLGIWFPGACFKHASWLLHELTSATSALSFEGMARGKSGKKAARAKGNGKNKDSGKGDLQQIRDSAPMFRVVPNLDHHFVRTWDYGTLVPTASDGGWSFAWTFDSFPAYTDFTTLYDAYRIDRVEVTWELVPTALTVTKSSAIMPIILAWPDYDDSTAPATLITSSQVSQMERFNMTEAKPSVRRSIVPRVALTSGVTAIQKATPWIDMATTNITHYGVKFWIRNFNNTTVTETGATVAVSFRMFCTCRNPR